MQKKNKILFLAISTNIVRYHSCSLKSMKITRIGENFRRNKMWRMIQNLPGTEKKNMLPVSIWHRIKLQPFWMPHSWHRISHISPPSKVRERERGSNTMPGQVTLLRTISKLWRRLKLRASANSKGRCLPSFPRTARTRYQTAVRQSPSKYW